MSSLRAVFGTGRTHASASRKNRAVETTVEKTSDGLELSPT